MSDHYLLDSNNHTYRVENLLAWARGMEALGDRRYVRQESLIDQSCWLSTVFLGIDHSIPLLGDSEPLLFETAILGKGDQFGMGDEMLRCATYEQALALHEDMALRHGFRAPPKIETPKGVQPVANLRDRKVRL